MRCTNPLFGKMPYYDGALGTDENGELHTFGRLYMLPTKDRLGKKIPLEERYVTFERLKSDPYQSTHFRFMIVKCGQCIGCRVNKAREWGVRCCLEAKRWKNNAFFTFTYDNEHVPRNENGVLTLNPDDQARFWDNFRSKLAYHFGFRGVRYLECGEYGDLSLRPHGHAIVFNLPDEFFDTLTYAFTKNGVAYYNSAFADSCWISSKDDGSETLGFLVISTEVNFKNACYVARYVVKKQNGPKGEELEKAGMRPVFMRCSNRPGIAKYYYDEHRDQIYKNDELFVDSAGKMRPPSYFDRLYNFEDPQFMWELKQLRSMRGENASKARMKQTDKSFAAVLEDEELINRRKLEKLKREG